MRRALCAALVIFSTWGVAHAETDLTDEDYRYLNDLHHKLSRMRRQMDTLMKDILPAADAQGVALAGDLGLDIRVDVSTDDKNIYVRADLPGMEKNRIDITLERYRFLKIAGSRETASKASASGVVRQERSYGKFERTIELPAEGVSEGIKATYKDGVLDVVIPKKKETPGEKIKINVQ